MSIVAKYYTRTVSDNRVIEKLEKIVQELEQDKRQCEIILSFVVSRTNSSGYSLGEATRFNLAEIRDQTIALGTQNHNAVLWAQINVSFPSIDSSIEINRHYGKEWYKTGLIEKDSEVTITHGITKAENEPENYSEASDIFAIIQKYFIPYNQAAAIEKALGPELAEYHNLREESLSRLENLSQDIVKNTHDYRQRLDSEVAKYKKELNESFAIRRETLKDEYKEHEDKLKIREKELESLRKELDDRTARHARREQSRNLQKKIASRSQDFTLTTETVNKRQPIHRIFIALIAISFGLILYSILWPTSATEGIVLWLELGRLPIGITGFALTALYYIRWNDHWFRQHADREFRLQQLALDVDRASYVTEMLLEWQEDKDIEIPAVMIDRLTAGLFIDSTNSEQIQHPSEEIVKAIVKAATEQGKKE